MVWLVWLNGGSVLSGDTGVTSLVLVTTCVSVAAGGLVLSWYLIGTTA